MRKQQFFIALGLLLPLVVFTNMTPVDPTLTNYLESSKKFGALIEASNCQGAVNYLIQTPEFESKSAAGGTQAYVNRLYSGILARQAESAGLAAWVNAIDANKMNRQRVAIHFVISPEFYGHVCKSLQAGTRIELDKYVKDLYAQLLLRAPSGAEIESFAARFNSGTPSSKASLNIMTAQKRQIDAYISLEMKAVSCADLLAKAPSLVTGIYPVFSTGPDREPHLAQCEIAGGKLKNFTMIAKLDQTVTPNCATNNTCVNYTSFFQTVTCNSTSRDFTDCKVQGNVVAPPYLVTKTAGTCNPDTDFGFQGDSMWTRNGCQGVFRVRVSPTRSLADIQRAQIRELYLTLLKREPDQGGWDSWAANMKNGMSIEQVRAYFLSSPEYRGLQQSAKSNVGVTNENFRRFSPFRNRSSD